MKNKKNLFAIIFGVLIFVALVALIVVLSIFYPPVPKVKKASYHVACVGDSITYGLGVYCTRSRDSYPAILNRLYGKKVQVINYGISDRTLMFVSDRPYIKEKQFAASLKCGADMFIIMLGSNDAKPKNWNAERYETELGEFVSFYTELPNHPKVVLMAPPRVFPVNGETVDNISDDAIRNSIVPAVKKTADEYGLKCINLYELTENHPEWFADGCHPNKKGNDAIAHYIYEEIKK